MLIVSDSLPAGAALLHDLCPVEARQLAESVIAVNHRPLHDLGVSQEEAGLCGEEEGGGVSGVSEELVQLKTNSRRSVYKVNI